MLPVGSLFGACSTKFSRPFSYQQHSVTLSDGWKYSGLLLVTNYQLSFLPDRPARPGVEGSGCTGFSKFLLVFPPPSSQVTPAHPLSWAPVPHVEGVRSLSEGFYCIWVERSKNRTQNHSLLEAMLSVKALCAALINDVRQLC